MYRIPDSLERIRLEKAAQDAGYDRTVETQGQWLVFRSTDFPQALGVRCREDGGHELGLTENIVAEQLMVEFELTRSALTSGDWPAIIQGRLDYPTLHRSIVRSAEMYRSTSSKSLRQYASQSFTLPDQTEVTR